MKIFIVPMRLLSAGAVMRGQIDAAPHVGLLGRVVQLDNNIASYASSWLPFVRCE